MCSLGCAARPQTAAACRGLPSLALSNGPCPVWPCYPLCAPQNALSFVGTAEKAVHITGASSPQDFLNHVVIPMLAMEGDKLPVRWGVQRAFAI